MEFLKKRCKPLEYKQLDAETKQFKATTSLLLQSTPALIKIFEDTVLSASNAADIQLESHIIGILEARRNDKEAKKFVKLKGPLVFEKAIIKTFELPATERVFDCTLLFSFFRLSLNYEYKRKPIYYLNRLELSQR